MKFKFVRIAASCAALFFLTCRASLAAGTENAEEVRQPHTPTLIFYLTGVENQKNTDAIRASVQKLKSAATIRSRHQP